MPSNLALEHRQQLAKERRGGWGSRATPEERYQRLYSQLPETPAGFDWGPYGSREQYLKTLAGVPGTPGVYSGTHPFGLLFGRMKTSSAATDWGRARGLLPQAEDSSFLGNLKAFVPEIAKGAGNLAIETAPVWAPAAGVYGAQAAGLIGGGSGTSGATLTELGAGAGTAGGMSTAPTFGASLPASAAIGTSGTTAGLSTPFSASAGLTPVAGGAVIGGGVLAPGSYGGGGGGVVQTGPATYGAGASPAGQLGTATSSGLGNTDPNTLTGWLGEKIPGLGISKGAGLFAGADLLLRYNQMQKLNDIANKSAQLSDPMNQAARFPSQDLLNAYLTGEQDITKQPMVMAELDFMQRKRDADLARLGMTDPTSGGYIKTSIDYMNEALNRSALPYLNALGGFGGFTQGTGGAGQVYGNYASQGTGAMFPALANIGNAFGIPQGKNAFDDFLKKYSSGSTVLAV